MAGKSTDWRPGPTVCRCCLTEGCYKDISTEYFWMGKREVYAEMLSDTFNVSISYSKSGGPNSNSRLICEPCISRLRDASDFRRQVIECEKTFMHHLDPGTSTVSEEIESIIGRPLGTDVKLERVKLEKSVSDDDDFDCTFPDDDDDDDDDMDDQPLTKLASKIPKKESVDIMDLLDNAKAAEKRKSTTKLKSTPTKKTKIVKKEVKLVKPSASKTTTIAKDDKKKKEKYDATRANAEFIISNTTAYPFRVNDKSILCVYCQELYEDPDIFRAHMEEEHDCFNVKVAFHHLPKTEFVKVDLTNLRCRICKQHFPNLEAVVPHLDAEHKKKIDEKAKFGVMPYFLQKHAFNCAVCEKNFPSLFHLNRHTITHFLSYVCHVCGNSYVATTGLLRHVRTKHQNYEAPCKTCNKVFPTIDAKEKHRRTEKLCMPYGCPKCRERFPDWKARTRHMEVAHGQTKKVYHCADCNIDFLKEKCYYEHFKLQHSEDCAVCKHCGLKFVSLYKLKRHIAKHSN